MRERLLQFPKVYSTYQSAVLKPGARERMVREVIRIPDGARVLDVGCGLGDYAPLIAPRCEYVGIDHNEMYVEQARRTWAGLGAQFILGDVADPVTADHGPYDVVFISGVLHHLADDEVTGLARSISPILKPDGRFVAVEPVFAPHQRLSARLIIAADRGRFVRNAHSYEVLLQGGFASVTSRIVEGLYRIPYTNISLECSGAVAAVVPSDV